MPQEMFLYEYSNQKIDCGRVLIWKLDTGVWNYDTELVPPDLAKIRNGFIRIR